MNAAATASKEPTDSSHKIFVSYTAYDLTRRITTDVPFPYVKHQTSSHKLSDLLVILLTPDDVAQPSDLSNTSP